MILVKKNLVEATLPPLLQSEGSKLPLYIKCLLFFWCELSSKVHKSFLCCLLGHTIISFFLSHRTSLFQSTQYYHYSIIAKRSYSSIVLVSFQIVILSCSFQLPVSMTLLFVSSYDMRIIISIHFMLEVCWLYFCTMSLDSLPFLFSLI